MKAIIFLTAADNQRTVRLNIDSIVAYGANPEGEGLGSIVVISGEENLYVTETTSYIDIALMSCGVETV